MIFNIKKNSSVRTKSSTISLVQAKKQLYRINKFSELTTIYSNLSTLEKIEFDSVSFVSKDCLLAKKIANLLSMTDSDFDAFFINASQLPDVDTIDSITQIQSNSPTPTPSPSPIANVGQTVLIYGDNTTGTILDFDNTGPNTFVVSTLGADGDTVNCLKSTATSQYQWTGRFTFSSPINVSMFEAMDWFSIWIKAETNPDLFAISFNGTGIQIPIQMAPNTTLNEWNRYVVSIQPDVINALNGTITSINFSHSSASVYYFDKLELIQSDAGSLRPANPELDNPPLQNGLPMVPADHILRADVSQLPVHPMNTAWLDAKANVSIHIDFGAAEWAGGPIGIPFTVVTSALTFQDYSLGYPNESDGVSFPTSTNYSIEYGTDKHRIVIRGAALYEGWKVFPSTQPTVTDLAEISGSLTSPVTLPFAGQISRYDLNIYGQRPYRWTSSTASGLPLYPTLIKYEDVMNGDLSHMSRITFSALPGAIWPASHKVSSNYFDPSAKFGYPFDGSSILPMGAIIRLKSTTNISGMSVTAQRIARGWMKHGIIADDLGGNGFVSGTPDLRWNDTHLSQLKSLKISDFEAVDVSSLIVSPASYQINV
jgi:hypothetical protein